MLQELITSKTRIKLLVKFFINAQNTGYLRGLETEFGESTNAIRMELNRFEEAGLLVASSERNRKVFRANTRHPWFGDIHRLLLKYTGIEQIVEEVINRLGNLERAYVTGEFAKGKPGDRLELLLVGDHFDLEYLNNLVDKAEKLVSFRVDCKIIPSNGEATELKQHQSFIPVWGKQAY
jgi:hypothetical protein